MHRIKTAFILNVFLFIHEVFALGWMMSGLSTGLLTSSGIRMLRYFTVDSNILMGVFALLAAIEEWKVWKGKKDDVSVTTFILKLAGTVSVTLTMLVTVFFLAPTTAEAYGPLAMFYNSNFFLHLFNPILSLVIFLCFEKTGKIEWKHTVTAILPMAIYAVYYVEEAISHSHEGIIDAGYDWYGFFFNGIRSAFIVLPLLLVITYAISFVLWKINRQNA